MTNKAERTDGGVGRRDFLKLAGVGCAATGVAAVVAKPDESDAAAKPGAAGYRETEHVRAYYRSARF